jgi:hypothetical protein
MVTGLAILLAYAAGWAIVGYGQAKGVNWYPHYPDFVLVFKARAGDRLAIDEIRERFRLGRMLPADSQDVITMVLDRHRAEPAPQALQAWCDLAA